MVSEIQSETDIIFVILDHFWPFYPPPPNDLENQNFEQIKKAPRDVIILHICAKNHDLHICMLPEIWSATDRIFGLLCHFLLFYLLATQKVKILKK